MFRIFRFGAGTYSIAVVLACTPFLLFQAYAHLRRSPPKGRRSNDHEPN